MKIAYLSFIILLAVLTVSAQVKKHTIQKKKVAVKAEPLLKNSFDSISYAYGMDLYTSMRRNANLVKDMKARGLKTINFAAFNKALNDAIEEKTPMLTPEQKTSAFLKFVKEKYAVSLADNNRFMAENKIKPGVFTTASGLQYMVLQEGIGKRLTLTDSIITTNYALKLALTGKEIESTYGKKPFVLPAIKDVIPGWIEGLQLMNVGAKYRLFIPYPLAYGDIETNPGMPPYSALIFDLEVLKVGR